MLPKERQTQFRRTHPEYYKNYMRERRLRLTQQKIEAARQMLYGKEE